MLLGEGRVRGTSRRGLCSSRKDPGGGFMAALLPLQVSRLVHAIKMGWIKPKRPREDTGVFYDLWAQEDHNSILGRHKMHVPAPKLPLPGHEESYNPPPEYLLTEEEVGRAGPGSPPCSWGRGGHSQRHRGGLSWPALTLTLQPGRGLCAPPRGVGRGAEELPCLRSLPREGVSPLPHLFPRNPLQKLAWEQQEPAERKLSFLPQRHDCLRRVPAFPRFIHQRFERCLDLYLCPRQRKMRVGLAPSGGGRGVRRPVWPSAAPQWARRGRAPLVPREGRPWASPCASLGTCSPLGPRPGRTDGFPPCLPGQRGPRGPDPQAAQAAGPEALPNRPGLGEALQGGVSCSAGSLLGHGKLWAAEQLLETGSFCGRVRVWGGVDRGWWGPQRAGYGGGCSRMPLFRFPRCFTRLPVPLSRCIVATPALCAASASLPLGSGWHQVRGPARPLLPLP